MSENLPAVNHSYLPTAIEFEMLQTIAKNAAASGLYTGVGSEQKIFMILLASREMGIPPIQALNGGLWNICGKIEISARLMGAMIRRERHQIKIIEANHTQCTIEGVRGDTGETYRSYYTIKDADRAGLSNKDVWKKHTEDMLYKSALTRLARRLFPDVIGPAYIEGEIREAAFEVVPESKSENDVMAITHQWESFLIAFPEEEHALVREYIDKYAAHWKKSISQSLIDYANAEKFLADFSKWKKKNPPKEPEPQQEEIVESA